MAPLVQHSSRHGSSRRELAAECLSHRSAPCSSGYAATGDQGSPKRLGGAYVGSTPARACAPCCHWAIAPSARLWACLSKTHQIARSIQSYIGGRATPARLIPSMPVVAFSSGPRSCIDQRFALTQSESVCARSRAWCTASTCACPTFWSGSR
ncbi:hypothetical protein B0H15DRAFT_818601 [Mycena belliarum]|uniref:Uncharacterized protein n=1 Tax=Mycena belliarum TaxID=1033014 RepID=A0AAD6XSG4_9AGAR|nr:hypothetical protein B0H15DRAFT_818601 [Mycena belliae]